MTACIEYFELFGSHGSRPDGAEKNWSVVTSHIYAELPPLTVKFRRRCHGSQAMPTADATGKSTGRALAVVLVIFIS